MEYPEIKYLFKYYSFNLYSLSVLIDRKVWFPKPARLNDPFDIDIDFTHKITPENLSYILGILKKRMISPDRLQLLKDDKNPDALNQLKVILNSHFQDDKKNFGIFCMSEDPKNILMWSCYSENHRGFCIQFTRSSDNKLGNIEVTRPVNYYHYPCPDPFSEEGSKRIYDEYFCTKAECWKHEKEWRMLNEEGDLELPLPGDISGVIFGMNMPSPQRKTVKKLLSDLNGVKYFEAIKAINTFEIEIIESEENDC